MDMKKLIGATVASFVILFVAVFLVHDVWLGTTYREMRDAGFSFRPEEAMRHRFWLIWVSAALYSILFVWVYAKRRVENPWVGQGIRYGVLMTLFTVMPSTINDYVVYNLPHTLVLHWMIAGLITLILMGLAAAAILKMKKSSAAEARRHCCGCGRYKCGRPTDWHRISPARIAGATRQ